ncbi:MAG: glucosaminidase domain-containing protein [Oleiphilaceae bacterium]|nr:glucosaminidase domain-containing protein [Oleiphilaceae bacterium]
MSRKLMVGGLILLLLLALILGVLVGALQLHDKAGTGEARRVSVEPLPEWARQPLPDFSQYQVVSERKAAFFDYLFPRVVLANQRVLKLRQHLRELQSKESLTEQDLEWLQSQSERLRVSGENGSERQMQALAVKLDVVAPSLVLAQAANESSWGTSRFATQGNNLFGQWCWTQGCGHVPNRRPEGATHEVARYDSPYGSIRSYIANLNRHEAYQSLRQLRADERSGGSSAGGVALARGLESYSERGLAYVREIQSMINFNQLTEYDAEFRRLLDSPDLRQELDQRVAEYEQRFGDNPSTP